MYIKASGVSARRIKDRSNEQMGFELVLENVSLKTRAFLDAEKTYKEEW